MNREAFVESVKSSQRPLVVEFWAPWCGPCKMMAPRLKKTAEQYAGRVDLLKINADESADVVKELRVMGIPTMIIYRDGKEIFRKVGAQTDENLEAIFEGAIKAEAPRVTLQPLERWLRFLSGAALTAWGITQGPAWLLVVVGAVILFSAVYDRCPIYAALSAQVKKVFGGQN